MDYSEADTLRCTHRPPCPGCPRFGFGLTDHPALERLRPLCRENGVTPELVPAAEARGYRTRARLAVRGRIGSPKLGIFQAGSHRIADIPHCVVHHPVINDAAALLKQAMRDVRAEPYADVPHRGLVRYLQVVVERATQRAQLVVVANATGAEAVAPLLERLCVLFGPRLHSAFFSLHDARSNAILGPRCEKWSGPDAVEEPIAGSAVFFPPDAFGQSHLALYEQIVERIRSWVPDASAVTELYAGTGAIGLALIGRAARVRFNELSSGSLHGLRMGIDALPPELRARAEVHAGDAGAHAALVADADVVIADPPRKGLEPALRAALCAAPPRRFIYVSCGLTAFLDDAHALLASGRLRLSQLVVFDLFTFTDHVELLARFDRR